MKNDHLIDAYKLLFQVCSISLIIFISLSSQVQGDCRDYTLGDCSTAPGPFVTNSGDVKNEEDCQFDCDKTYNGQDGKSKCQFYVWDYWSNTCGLYNYTMADYINYCNVMAGSPLPGLNFCHDSNDECMVSTLRCLI